jgi:uncharacterized protein YjiS (DUF1127 family)
MMEIIMSTIFSMRASAQGTAGQSRVSGLLAIAKRWWVAYITWRIKRAAIAQLCSMSDRELKDIGLARSDITCAMRGEAARDRAFSLYY